MTFVRKTWADGDTGGTPITAAELNRIETGIAAAAEAAGLARVATSGAYNDLEGVPALAPVAISGSYSSLDGAPSLATVATTGSYTDLTAKPTLATVATTGSYNDLTNLPATGTGTDTTASFGAVALDSFGGADDDAKLTNALAAVSADTYHRTILFGNRLHTFNTANRAAFSGMRIAGPTGYSNSDKGAAFESCEVKLSFTGPWFTNNNANVYDVDIRNLSFKGTSTATVLGQVGTTASTSWWRLHMRDISASGVKSVLGTQAQQLLMTGAVLDGYWEVNNTYNSGFVLGGSDNRLWTDGGFFDSDPAFNTAGSATGQPIIWFNFCENTSVGPLYITAESLWTGIKISGPAYGVVAANQGGPLNFWGLQVEGRNATQASNGALVRLDGGIARFRDCGFHYAMVSPTTPGRTPVDAGVIHHEGGSLLIDGATYDRATGVAETVPFVYTAGVGDCIVRSVTRVSRVNTWTGRPRVQLKAAATENRITDATVTLI